ncbi:MAG: SIMPL domain-containing protein [Treponema sp.]|nr:SIMPL domain-containing protein [Treponema sp.]
MKTRHFLVYVLVSVIVFVSACNNETERKNQSTISVFGIGTVSVQPDIIQMSITLSKVAQTTKTAQEEVSRMVRQAIKILKDANIEDKNINTASLSFRSEYDYYSSRRNLIGQRAEQRITFSIEDISNDDEKASGIIDQLIQIDGIELNEVSYSVKNTTEYYVKSRELAYQKAVEKASQYAELSKLTIVKVSSIADQGTQQVSPMSNSFNRQLADVQSEAKASGSTVLPIGELEITTNILVIFLLK